MTKDRFIRSEKGNLASIKPNNNCRRYNNQKYVHNNTQTVIAGFPCVIVEKQVFWVVSQCDCAVCFPGFDEVYCLHEVITLNIKAVHSFETS
jgi:hypothetical protein